MVLVDKLDELGKPAWIALMILGFMAWWPIGLLVLVFFLGTRGFGSRRMGCWHHQNSGEWHERWQAKMERMQDKMDRVRARMDRARGCDWWRSPPSSGNRAFDEYRSETLKRLEEEQREFKEFLERLRFAKDRAEFDQFMSERRNRAHDQGQPQPPPPQPQSPPQA
jgi:hypothetical protein